MKRFAAIISLCLCLLILNFSSVDAGAVRIADVGVYNFVQTMRSIVYDMNKEMVNVAPINISDAVRATYLDKNYNGCVGYTSKILEKGTNKQKALVNFYVNGQGYISRSNVMLSDIEDSQASGMAFGVTLISLGVSQDEYLQFYKRFWNKMQAAIAANNGDIKYRDSIYCSAKKRYFDLYFYKCTKGHHHIDITGRV